MMIELHGVTKAYRTGWLRGARTVQALDGVDLQVGPGTALALVGLNGAGKSTLLRVLLGYVRPTAGEARIQGLSPRSYVQRFGVAYVPENVTVPSRWTVRGALRYYAMLGDLGIDAWDRVDRALERTGLSALVERKIGTLSKGNLQRIGIAQAILGDRKLLVLDEPTDGLDPVWIVEMRQIVSEWLAEDSERILVLASHNLAEVERVATRTLVLHNGRIAGELGAADTPGALERGFLRLLEQLEEGRS